ncbi:MAG: leucyl aminopeptidase [bacterium]|nr:leucyl aminopeptidase [bacterium]
MKISLANVDRGRKRLTVAPQFAGPCEDIPDTLGGAVPEELGQTVLIDGARNAPMLVISTGKGGDFDPERMRRVGGVVARWIRQWKRGRVGVDLRAEEAFRTPEVVGALCEGLHLGSYVFDRHRGKGKPAPEPDVELWVSRPSEAQRRAVRRAALVSQAANLSREWGHEPPNVINPATLAARARTLARKTGLKCTVLDEKRAAALKMGALLAVGQGSATPSRLIVLEHRGTTKGKPVVLVGKAITFDTGGYSLKSGEAMTGMKYDKCGGMQIIGVMQALAALKYKRPVVGIIAAAENMISAKSYRPDDIIRTMAGKTVQIVSADAEGRLVLCDALTYAQKKYQPRCIIDVATLTGGVVIALGRQAAGIFCEDGKLRDSLVESGRRTFERLWPLPVWDDYFPSIKGEDSDLKNSGGRDAHATVGAIFLKQFVDKKIPWAHIDIAGVSDLDKDGPYCPKGATGFGVRLLVDWLERL